MGIGALSGAAGFGAGSLTSGAIQFGGFAGGSLIGAAGGAAGGLIRGISDYKNGYDFWDGSRTTDFVVPDNAIIDYDTKRVAKSYNESFGAIDDTENLQWTVEC